MNKNKKIIGIPILFQHKFEILLIKNELFKYFFSLSDSGNLILSNSKNSF